MKKVIRANEVTDRIGFRKTKLYQLIRDGQFPKGFPLGGNSVGWLDSEVDLMVAAYSAGFNSQQITDLTKHIEDNRQKNAPFFPHPL